MDLKKKYGSTRCVHTGENSDHPLQDDSLQNGGSREPIHSGEYMTHNGRFKNDPEDEQEGEHYVRQ